jgi:ribosomal protein S18 acetylase RimI-like enzyme
MNMLFFPEGHRRKGFGKKLVLHWEKDMKEKGYKKAMTSTQSDEEAQHFYRKMGYTEIGGFRLADDPLEIIFYKDI